MSAVPVFPPPHLVPSVEDEVERAADEGAASMTTATTTTAEPQRQIYALPAPPSEDERQQASARAETTAGTVDVSADASTIKFDALGPLVVNSDGTLSRIHNWVNMTDAERERTLRVLGKRNQLRIADLKANQATAGTSNQDEGEAQPAPSASTRDDS